MKVTTLASIVALDFFVSPVAVKNVDAVLPVVSFANGFGKTKSISPTKKTHKIKKERSIEFLHEDKDVSTTSNSSLMPKLDRFGLPVLTQENIFPPLSNDVIRVPFKSEGKSYKYKRHEIADAMKQHLGVNLDAFDEHGYSTHSEHCSIENVTTRWKLRLLHKDPPVFEIANFFTGKDCQDYISIIDPTSANYDKFNIVQIKSPTFSSLSVSRRTSTTWFCRYEGLPSLLAKAQRLLNVDLNQMEEPQLVRYLPGEEFSWHYDEIPSSELTNGGQRLATLLVYLNDLKESDGGGTVFRDLESPTFTDKKLKFGNIATSSQLTVQPRAGKALLFFPSYKDGVPDIRTLHKGEVSHDTKMIAQLWIHQKAYHAGVPDGNLQENALEKVVAVGEQLGFFK